MCDEYMIYLSYLSFLFFGVVLGIMLQKYIFSIFDIILDLYSYKQTQKAMEYQLNTQIMNIEFLREYPEANQGYQELPPAIGFSVGRNGDDGYEDDDDDCDGVSGNRNGSKNVIGF